MVMATEVRHDGTWRWVGWASWPVSSSILVVAGLALVVDMTTAWAGKPEWYLDRILVSPALPLAVLLLVLIALRRAGREVATVRAWREFLVVTGAAIAAAALGYAHSVASWREVEGVVLIAAGEEVVYRLGAVLLVGAACARVMGRDWRDTAAWGTGPVCAGLLGAGVLFSVLPGHVAQMSGVGNAYPFMSLAVLLGYGAFRTGAVLPCILVHLLLNLLTLAFFAGTVGAGIRLAVAGAVLIGFAAAILPAGRRVGTRRRVPAVIDLRTPDVIDLRDPATPETVASGAAATPRD